MNQIQSSLNKTPSTKQKEKKKLIAATNDLLIKNIKGTREERIAGPTLLLILPVPLVYYIPVVLMAEAFFRTMKSKMKLFEVIVI